VNAAIEAIILENDRLDVVIHNAGQMVFGPAEAFTTEQFAQLYNTNVLGTQRVNRAALPHLRKLGEGLIVWVSSSSTRGGTPPYLAPYFAAKAAMDSLAVSYALELSRWGIESSIVTPGVFTSGTKFFENAGSPDDKARLSLYENGPYKHMSDYILKGLTSVVPVDADANDVADAIVRVVSLPFGTRPFRIHVDPANDGVEVVNAVADSVRTEFLRNIGLSDLLKPVRRIANRNTVHDAEQM
jgi:NAD(P)-dependent dehydrogenase (short-subunit alcohol dehydrogenase family)